MNLPHTFPELNEGQLKMLERYVREREARAIQRFQQGQRSKRN